MNLSHNAIGSFAMCLLVSGCSGSVDAGKQESNMSKGGGSASGTSPSAGAVGIVSSNGGASSSTFVTGSAGSVGGNATAGGGTSSTSPDSSAAAGTDNAVEGGVAGSSSTVASGGALAGTGGVPGGSGASFGGDSAIASSGGNFGASGASSVSQGGATAIGGTTSVAGTTATGGTIATGSTIAVAGTTASNTGGNVAVVVACNGDIVPAGSGALVVSAEATGASYVNMGDFNGYASTWTWKGTASTATGTCITPGCSNNSCAPAFSGTALCVAGDVAPDATYESNIGVGFNLNQGTDVRGAIGSIPAPTSITVTAAAVGPQVGNASLRVQLSNGLEPATHWCVEAGSWTSGVPIPISRFNTKCWDPSTGTALSAGTPIQSVSLTIPSDATTDRPFSFCLAGVTTGAGPVTSALTAKSVSGGYKHSCALLVDGTLRCWGLNDNGELGNGTTVSTTLPVSVSGINNAIWVSAGYYHSCAVVSDGTVRCWGYNGNGELGDGTLTSRSMPVTVTGISNAIAVAVGGMHSCAILSDGSVRCWGDNSYGQLGDATLISNSVPVTVSGIANATKIATGLGHTCAVLSTGDARCWGVNNVFQLGYPIDTNQSAPVTVMNIINHQVSAIAAGTRHSCAVVSGGWVQCWGYNANGQAGIGSTSYSKTAAQVSGIANAIDITTGAYHTCALLEGGSLSCWGDDTVGQLGISDLVNRTVPVAVPNISGVRSVSGGYAHTCVVLTDGKVQCWGLNAWGQLGNGTRTNSSVPTTVEGF